MNLKKSLLLLIAVITAVSASSQQNFLNISAQAGSVLNTDQDKSFGIGGSVTWLHQDGYLAKSENNYLTLTLKGFNNPYGEGKFISSVLNDKGDGFNYITALAGYRVAFQQITDGFFLEPRLGVGFFAEKKSSFLFSPMVGYTVKKIDIGVYCDMGFSKENYAIKKDNFFTLGVSVGYNIGL
jgi:hypothetical protein